MKTIEEKAQAAWEDYTYPEGNLYSNVFKDAYKLGATEALTEQWRESDDTEGLQEGEQVIVAIQRIDNSIKYFYAAYYHNGKFWDDSDDSEIYFCNLWMRLPAPKNDKK